MQQHPSIAAALASAKEMCLNPLPARHLPLDSGKEDAVLLACLPIDSRKRRRRVVHPYLAGHGLYLSIIDKSGDGAREVEAAVEREGTLCRHQMSGVWHAELMGFGHARGLSGVFGYALPWVHRVQVTYADGDTRSDLTTGGVFLVLRDADVASRRLDLYGHNGQRLEMREIDERQPPSAAFEGPQW